MKYKAIIFDFDDTLIISGEIKFNAFFKVFSSFLIEKKIIENILKEFPELNRYDTISKIIKQSKLDINNTLISDMYSDLVKKEILNANSLEFTEIILDKLFNFIYFTNLIIYICVGKEIKKCKYRCIFSSLLPSRTKNHFKN